MNIEASEPYRLVTDVPDGEYSGIWFLFAVRFVVFGERYLVFTEFGSQIMQSCLVNVQFGKITVETE